MITIVDYGMGNLRSVQKAFDHLQISNCLTQDPKKILSADKIVLPGVGAFKDCMDQLKQLNLIEPLREAISLKKPYLGICLGMQILLSESEEFGHQEGLNIIPGQVLRFPEKDENQNKLNIPHVGWNQVSLNKNSPLFEGIESDSYFYFVHSYFCQPQESKTILGKTHYGIEFCSSIGNESCFGVQFHPEKSQEKGLKLLKNFAQL